jgi:hypothetical protein
MGVIMRANTKTLVNAFFGDVSGCILQHPHTQPCSVNVARVTRHMHVCQGRICCNQTLRCHELSFQSYSVQVGASVQTRCCARSSAALLR